MYAPDVDARPVLLHPDAPCYVLPDGRALARVSTVLREAGLADFSGPWFTAEVRARGTAVHRAIHLLVQDDLDWSSLDPVLAPYLDAFMAWRRESGYHVLASEVRVSDPVLGYAGTADLFTSRDGHGTQYVVDVKCGHVPKTVGLQTAAYARCLTESWRFRAVLNLRSNGTYCFTLLDDPDDEDTFLAALRLFHWRRRHAG